MTKTLSVRITSFLCAWLLALTTSSSGQILRQIMAPAAGGGGTPTWVGTAVTCSDSTFNSTNQTCATYSVVNSGDLLIIRIDEYVNGGVAAFTASDTQTSGLTCFSVHDANQTVSFSVTCYGVTNATGTDTVTCTKAAVLGNCGIAVVGEINGLTSNVLDVSASNTGARCNDSPPNGGSATTAGSPRVLIGSWSTQRVAQTYTAGTTVAYTKVGEINNGGWGASGASEYFIDSGSGLRNADFACQAANTNDLAAMTLAFK